MSWVEVLFRIVLVLTVIAGVLLAVTQQHEDSVVNSRHEFHQTQVCAQLKSLTRAITVDPSLSGQVKASANAYYVSDCVASG